MFCAFLTGGDVPAIYGPYHDGSLPQSRPRDRKATQVSRPPTPNTAVGHRASADGQQDAEGPPPNSPNSPNPPNSPSSQGPQSSHGSRTSHTSHTSHASPSSTARRHTVRRDGQKRPVVRAGSGLPGQGFVSDVDTWRDSLRDAIVEMDATPLATPGSPDYTGWVYLLDLGPISLTDVASDPVYVARTPRLINHNPVDFFHLSISRRPSRAEQRGRQHHLGAGDAILVDSSEPFSVTADTFAHYLILNVPRASLRRDLRMDRHMLGQYVSAQNPSLRVLMSLLAELGRGAPGLPAETVHELGHTAHELLVSSLRLAESGHRHFADARMSRGAQLLRMKDFAVRHLADPDLSPKLLAAAFDVSVRYVELAFRESGVSPSRFIRETRLAEARRMLADPRQRHRSIAAIGRSVGIENASVFARIFRARYEATPREYRQYAGVRPL